MFISRRVLIWLRKRFILAFKYQLASSQAKRKGDRWSVFFFNNNAIQIRDLLLINQTANHSQWVSCYNFMKWLYRKSEFYNPEEEAFSQTTVCLFSRAVFKTFLNIVFSIRTFHPVSNLSFYKMNLATILTSSPWIIKWTSKWPTEKKNRNPDTNNDRRLPPS